MAMATGALVSVVLCAGWQGNRLSADRPEEPSEVSTGGMDAGVAEEAPRTWERRSAGTSPALATRHLAAGMVGRDEGPRLPVPSCRAPVVQVPATEGCATGASYPECRWRMPEPARAGHAFDRWRNTRRKHWWGSPALVTVVLGAAEAYARRFPGERIVVGDLDAPGPRHETHDRGVDVDLYLPGVMEASNVGARTYPSNYRDRPHLLVRMRRARVEALARILAACTGGNLRIYYNDPPLADRFGRWFERRGFRSSFGTPMQAHNALHRFHFHVTIGDDHPPLEGPSGRPPPP